MNRRHCLAVQLAAALAVSGCGGSEPAAQGDGGNGIGPGAAVPAQLPAPDIPVALRGTWGGSVADCNDPQKAAEPLFTVDAGSVRFAGQRGRPTRNVKLTEDSISGDFVFEGSQAMWVMRLRVIGDRLVRTDDSQAESHIYVRCE